MLRNMSVLHPAAKMLVDLANAQDIEAGDGTTSVVVIAGSMLGAADKLLEKGMWCRNAYAAKVVTNITKEFIRQSSLKPSNEQLPQLSQSYTTCRYQSTCQIVLPFLKPL
jgi:chaperonin GroEL (HSP60 family)